MAVSIAFHTVCHAESMSAGSRTTSHEGRTSSPVPTRAVTGLNRLDNLVAKEVVATSKPGVAPPAVTVPDILLGAKIQQCYPAAKQITAPSRHLAGLRHTLHGRGSNRNNAGTVIL